MDQNKTIGHIGENLLISIIERIITLRTGKGLIRDDSFFYSLDEYKNYNRIIFNSDMLVSTTDIPKQMSFFQIGRKAVIMNLSDLIVKGVRPKGIIISLGLPKKLSKNNFKDLIEGIVNVAKNWDVNYIGGDINQSKELIINPTVFGFQNHEDIIYRSGINQGDYLVSNGKFGLTGVGFHILLKKKGNIDKYKKYNHAIKSVLEPNDISKEAYVLAENHIATASIDSSDGLGKSLLDLMISNPNKGFEVDFNPDLITTSATEYSKEFKINLEELVFNGGEEFIHLFTITPGKLETAKNIIKSKGGTLIKIGKVISEEAIYLQKKDKRVKLQCVGYEHFT
ncbi:MAG: thiamine-monophosphate kinase [Candidatus Thorarchaeota archaeon]